MKKNLKTIAAALGLGAIATGGVLASAASLGTSTAGSLGSGTQLVASCDTDGVDVAYSTVFSTATGTYNVDSVTISGINAACATRKLDLVISQLQPGVAPAPATYVSLFSGSVAALPAATSVTIPVTGTVAAADVTNAAIVIA